MAVSEDLRVVIVGSGRTGLRTARFLDDRGHDVVIIERNPERVAELVDEHVATIIEGDATDSAVLRQADLGRVDVLVAMTDTMGTNFTVCTLAKDFAPEIRTVMRSVFETTRDYADYADEIIFPERAGARTAVNAVEHGVRSLDDTAAQVELLEIEVAPAAPVAGQQLAETRFPQGSVVISNVEQSHIVSAETELNPGETYVVAVEPDVADEVRRLFRG
ncbi:MULTISPECIES: potassium channel family protein [Salinibaculum]|uniref:potassium channel family protein n=1 Tax=Salinibaculum TaxID=2732368 RepID=UPI0030CB0656